MKNVVVSVISFFWIVTTYAQSEPIKDSRGLKKFNKYVNSVITQRKERLILDTIPKPYRVMYSTSCNYFEHWMRNDSCAYGTQGKSFINQPPVIDTLPTDDMFAQIKLPYICAENPIFYNGEKVVFTLKNGTLINVDKTSQFNIDITPSYGWRYSPKMSYNSGRFLILETNTLDNNGNELLHGVTTTFFLERIE